MPVGIGFHWLTDCFSVARMVHLATDVDPSENSVGNSADVSTDHVS